MNLLTTRRIDHRRTPASRPHPLLLAFLALAAVAPRHASAWGPAHEIIARAALELLAPEERALIGDQADPFARRYSLYPDMPADPEAKRYLIAFPKEAEVSFHIPRHPAHNRILFEAYLPKVLTLLREGNRIEALRFFGCIAHHLQDSAAPGHPAFGETKVPPDGPPLLALEFFKRFLPMPDAARDQCLHARIDSCPLTLEQLRDATRAHRPRLLGHCVEEWVFNLVEEHWRMNERSCRRLIPMLTAMGDGDAAREVAIGAECAADAARLLADSLHTLVALATGAPKDEPEPRVDLSSRAPSRPYPFAWTDRNHLGQAIVGASGAFCVNSSEPRALGRHPLQLRMPDGSIQSFPRGLGVGWNHSSSFLLPPGVFRVFTAKVGNDAALGTQTVCTFEILLDQKPVFATSKMTGAIAAVTLEIPLGQAREITLRTVSEGTPSRTHAVWAKPTLHR